MEGGGRRRVALGGIGRWNGGLDLLEGEWEKGVGKEPFFNG